MIVWKGTDVSEGIEVSRDRDAGRLVIKFSKPVTLQPGEQLVVDIPDGRRARVKPEREKDYSADAPVDF